MNESAHSNIFQAAFDVLPDRFKIHLAPSRTLLEQAGNYPDFFDDPTRQETEKACIDPNWRRYCDLERELNVKGFHFWSSPIDEQFGRTRLYKWYLDKMTEALKNEETEAFIKYAGCLSHAIGDSTQPAHLGPDPNNTILAQLLPTPNLPQLKDFHYHTTVESITGKVSSMHPARFLGLSTSETAWMLSALIQNAVRYCRRFVIPTIQAIFENDIKKAEKLAIEPVTIAAELTRDSMRTILMLQEAGDCPAQKTVDLRTLPAMHGKHDMVYGDIILDGNKNVPPSNVPVTPGRLLDSSGEHIDICGLGMLPGSGMLGERSSYSTWSIPSGVFSKFTALVGLNCNISQGGAVEFCVELDGKIAFSSGRMTCETPAISIEVPLGESVELTLEVRDANNGSSFFKNHGYWGRPMLVR